MAVLTTAAIAYRPNEPMIIEEVKLDPPGEGEVLVEVKSAGLCHTDLGWLEGHSPIGNSFPVVLGHEGAGVVLEVGPGVTETNPGDHVVIFAHSAKSATPASPTRAISANPFCWALAPCPPSAPDSRESMQDMEWALSRATW